MLIICIINFVAADDKWSDLTGFCLETGVHRGPPDRGVHVRRHDEDQVVALRSQKSSRTHSKISAGNAGTGNGGIALEKYHQTRTHQHDSQLPQGNTYSIFFIFLEFGQLTSFHFIWSDEAGFYKPTILKFRSPNCWVRKDTTMPVKLSTIFAS